MRLDQYLVRNGQFESREKAQQAINDGGVFVNQVVAKKASQKIHQGDSVKVNQEDRYVSRAAYKLLAALKHFGLSPQNHHCIDIGSSTGGFTQVLLQHGAAHVTAVDVGTDQLHSSLRTHKNLTIHESTDIREFAKETSIFSTPNAPTFITADLSFISLTKVLTTLQKLTANSPTPTHLLLLFKPQFEVGRQHLKKGISKHPDPEALLEEFAVQLNSHNFKTPRPAFKVPTKGKAGNQEYFIYTHT